MLPRLHHWSQHLLANAAAVLPCACALCGQDSRAPVCEGCEAQVFHDGRNRCFRCAIPLADGGVTNCGACLRHPPAFDASVTAVDYAPPVDQLVLALKFGKHLELAPLMAAKLRDAIPAMRPTPLPTVLTVVPLGGERLAQRGFNQALEIARPLSRALGVRLDGRLLVRQRETRAQALLHPDERRRNVRNAFVVAGHAIDRVRGIHVGVVDDVMTTGETLNEIAATLKRFGAARVTNFVFARTAQQ